MDPATNVSFDPSRYRYNIELPSVAQIEEIKSSLQTLGHTPALAGALVEGALAVMKYRGKRDARHRVLKKIKEELRFLTVDIEESLEWYAKAEAWKIPRLELQGSSVRVEEMANEESWHEVADALRAKIYLKDIGSLVTDWEHHASVN